MSASVKGPVYYLVEVQQDVLPGAVVLMCPTLPAAQKVFSALLGATVVDEYCSATGGWMNLIGVIDPHDESVPRVLLQQERWEP